MGLAYSFDEQMELVVRRVFRKARQDCQICYGGMGENRRLVRDHNHATGYMRGPLCDLCNSWLGLYERKGEEGLDGRVREWWMRYRENIEVHLRQDTGIRYSRWKG